MADTITSQNIDVSSWGTLYIRLSWDLRRISGKKYKGPVCRLEVCVMQVAGPRDSAKSPDLGHAAPDTNKTATCRSRTAGIRLKVSYYKTSFGIW
jgi:hypothetical protein